MSRWATPAKKRSLQWQLAERDGGKYCFYCGMPLILADEVPTRGVRCIEGVQCEIGEEVYTTPSGHDFAQIDHVQPRSKGGSNKLDNLVLCCSTCNAKKGACV